MDIQPPPQDLLAEMVLLMKQQVAALRDLAEATGAQRAVLNALIELHPSPKLLAAQLLDQMDRLADQMPADRLPLYREATRPFLDAALAAANREHP